MTRTTACWDCQGYGVRVLGVDVIQCRTCRGSGVVSPEDRSSPAGRHIERGT